MRMELRYGLEGIGEEARGNATQFHAWVTNPYHGVDPELVAVFR